VAAALRWTDLDKRQKGGVGCRTFSSAGQNKRAGEKIDEAGLGNDFMAGEEGKKEVGAGLAWRHVEGKRGGGVGCRRQWSGRGGGPVGGRTCARRRRWSVGRTSRKAREAERRGPDAWAGMG
jgi:hypothetical protein